MNYSTSPKTHPIQSLVEPFKHFLKTTLPGRIRNLNLILFTRPPVGWINFGTLRRLTPISRDFGYDRGLPIDRYYIHQFLAAHQNEIQGRVMEIGERTYTRQFGGDRVTHSDVLHVIEGNPEATFIGDLTTADHIPSNMFDCIILTQTLHLIYDMKAAVATLYRTLKPGGVLLITVPGISQVVKCDWGDDWCWALTTQSARLLLEEYFPKSDVQVEAYGNVLTAAAFLYGAATEDLSTHELDYRDPEYQCLITLRAVKPGVNHEA
jgi:SAM-dependent methyltransferase